jgi:hypothetical protein
MDQTLQIDNKMEDENNVVVPIPEPDYSKHGSDQSASKNLEAAPAAGKQQLDTGIGTHLLWRNINMAVVGNR